MGSSEVLNGRKGNERDLDGDGLEGKAKNGPFTVSLIWIER